MSRGSADTFEFTTLGSVTREFIAMGIPTFGQVNVFWASRTFGMLRHPMNRPVRQFIVTGAEVGLARNHIVARALAIEQADPSLRCSHVFFVDDDVLVHPEALLKLLSDDRDIVSGLYYAKTSVPQALILHGESDGIEQKWRPGDIVNCWAHGMGMTLIRAEVFRRVRDELDIGIDANGNPKWFETHRDEPIVRADGVPAFWNQTEDVTFLRKAAQLGYQPCVDTSSAAFGWHWAQNEQRAYPVKQWREYQDDGRITWTDTPDGQPVVWEETAA